MNVEWKDVDISNVESIIRYADSLREQKINGPATKEHYNELVIKYNNLKDAYVLTKKQNKLLEQTIDLYKASIRSLNYYLEKANNQYEEYKKLYR